MLAPKPESSRKHEFIPRDIFNRICEKTIISKLGLHSPLLNKCTQIKGCFFFLKSIHFEFFFPFFSLTFFLTSTLIKHVENLIIQLQIPNELLVLSPSYIPSWSCFGKTMWSAGIRIWKQTKNAEKLWMFQVERRWMHIKARVGGYDSTLYSTFLYNKHINTQRIQATTQCWSDDSWEWNKVDEWMTGGWTERGCMN